MLPTKEEWDAWNQEEANKKKAAVKSPLADNQYGVKLSLEDFDQIAKPVQQDDSGDFMRGAKTAFKQVPQLGWGLVAGAGAAAESAFGEGGIASAVRQRGVEGYQEWGQDIAKDAKDTDEFSTAWEKTKAGDLGAIVDWAQHGLGYAAGQGIQLLATGGLGGAVAKGVGTGAVKAVAGRMIAKETAKLAAQQAGKKIARDELEKIALKNVASRIGQAAAVGAQAYGMEGGEIFGELASETDGVLTAEEIAKGGLATLAAGTLEFIADKVSLGVMKGSSKVFGKKSAEALKDETKKAFLSRLAAQVGKGVATDAPTEFGTEYGQTLIEKWGAGGDPSTSEAHQEAFNAAMQGAIGGAAYGTAGGAINTVFGEETQAAPVDETTPQIENPPGPRPTRLSALNQIEEEIFQLQSSERDPATGRPAPKNADHYAQLDDLERRKQTLLESLTPEESADHTMSAVNKEVNQLRSELGLPVHSAMAEDESVSSAPGATRSKTLLPDEMQTTQSRPQAPYGTISEYEGVGTQTVEKVAGQAPQTAQSRLTEVQRKIANLEKTPEKARSPKMLQNLQGLKAEETALTNLFTEPGNVSPAGQQAPNILYAEEEGIGRVGQTPVSTNPQEISSKLVDGEAQTERQPWEMTRDDAIWGDYIPSGRNTEKALKAQVKIWQNRYDSLSDAERAERSSEDGIVAGLNRAKSNLERANAHRSAVQQAVSEGKPVPAAVLQEYAGEEWADKALVQKGQVVAPKSANKIEFNPDDLDREKVIRGYSHTSRDPSGVAKMEQQSYVEFMEELRDDMLKDLPEGKEDILNAELQRVKDAYLKRRYSVLNVRGNTVSSMIAGKSKFNFKQAESRNNALDKAEKNFDDWLKQVKQDVAKKTGVADVRAKRKTDETIRKQQAVEATRKKEKEVKAEQNKLPIINYPGERTKTITSEEWNKTSKDYKSILVSDDGTYRYRSMMREGGLFPVFLSDKKEIRPKILTSSSVADQELAKTSPDYSDPRLKRKEFRDVISGYTDSITTAGKNPTSFVDLGAEGTQVIRHGSVHPPLIQKAIATAGSVKDLRNAVRKAANGDKLGTRQAEAVRLVLDQMQEEVNSVREGEVRNVRGKQTELRNRRDAYRETAQPATGEEFEATRKSGENARAEQIADDFYVPPAEEANEYPAEWDAETKTLADLYAEARKYDNEAADSLLESQAEDSEIATQLWEIIQDGRKGEGSSQVVQGEGFSLKGEAQKRQAREEEQLGLSGIKAAKPEFGKRPDLDKGRENVERLPLADEIAEKEADAAQQDLFGVADQNPTKSQSKQNAPTQTTWNSIDGKKTVIGQAKNRPDGWLEIAIEGSDIREYRHSDDLYGIIADDEKQFGVKREEDGKVNAEQNKKEAQKSDNMGGFLDITDPKRSGQVRKALGKLYSVKGRPTSLREHIENLSEQGSLETDTLQEPKIKPLSDRQFFQATTEEQKEHAKRMAEAGEKTIYLVNGSDYGKIAYDYANFLLNSKKAQQNEASVADQNPASVTDKEGSVAPVSDKIKPDAPISRTAHDVSVDDTIYLQDDYENKRHPVNFRGWIDNDTAMVIYNGWQMSFSRERLFKNDLASNDVASESDKGKSSHARTDGNTDKALFSLAPKSWYFSPLSRAVNSIDSKAMPGKDWLNRLKKMPGVKAEELQWTGLPEYLEMQQGKVRKEDVLEFLDQNGVQVQELERGGELQMPETYNLAKRALESLGYTVEGETVRRDGRLIESPSDAGVDAGLVQALYEASDLPMRNHETKYESYTLPGGKNYRELLLTLPDSRESRMEAINEKISALVEKHGPTPEMSSAALTEYNALEKQYYEIADADKSDFRSSHWDEPNVLAHIRLNEREVNGEKVLFVEEIQSDWNIEGRKKGFGQQEPTYSLVQMDDGRWGAKNRLRGEISVPPTTTDMSTPEARQAFIDRYNNMYPAPSGAPTAPFVQSNAWQALTLKRVLRLAAEEGFDRVSWVNGEQTAERYSLDKKLKSIWYRKNGDGTYNVEAFAMEDGNSVVRDSGVSIDRVEELLGKEIAKRISEEVGEKRPSGEISLSGDDLKIEAQWARNLYDKAVPNFMNQFGKKYGVAVEEVKISLGQDGWKSELDEKRLAWSEGRISTAEYESFKNKLKLQGAKESPQQSIAITDEMRSELMKEGAPLFSQAETTNDKLKEDVDRLKNRVETLKAKFTKQEVEAEIKRLTSKWKNAPKIIVIESVDELPGDIKDQALSMPDGDKIEGVYIPGPNEIFIISSNMPNTKRIEEIIVHEAIGHHGIESIVDQKEFFNILLQLSLVRPEELNKVAEGYGFSLTNKEERLSAAKEVLARMAERGESNGFIRRTIALIKDALRRLGFELEYTDTDFKALIAKGRKFVEKGVTVSGKKAGLAQFAAAWHGTPHKFDRFSTEFVGAGEGNQAYGWGLYFASAKEVAEHYKEKLSESTIADDDTIAARYAREGVFDAGEFERISAQISKKAVSVGEESPGVDYYKFSDGSRIIADEENGSFFPVNSSGHLYQVELAPSEDEYLLWDKPITEQSAKVRTAINKNLSKDADSMLWYDWVLSAKKRGLTGEEFYKEMAGFPGEDGNVTNSTTGMYDNGPHDKAASEYLHSIGIRGIKYLDGTSRGKGEGDFNYVIFDDNDVEIKAQFSLHTGDTTMDAELDKTAPGWRDHVAQMTHKASGTIPERAKAMIGKFLSNPWFGSEGKPARRQVVNQNLQRTEDRTAMVYDLSHQTDNYQGMEGLRTTLGKMNTKQRREFDRLVKKGDIENMAYSDDELKQMGVSASTIKAYHAFRQVIDKSRDMMFERLNDLALIPYEGTPIYNDLKELMNSKRSVKEIKEDKSLDEDLRKAFVRLRTYRTRLTELKQQWGFWKGYAPRVRPDGEWFVRAYQIGTDGNRKQVYMRPAISRTGAESLMAKVQKNPSEYLKGNYDKNTKYEFKVDRNTAVPEEMMQMKGSDMAIEALINRAMESATKAGDMTESQASAMTDAILQELNDQIAARGFGRTRIERQKDLIEGYDDENYADILQSHISGMAGWITKSEFSIRSTRAASKIKDPSDKTWVLNYSHDAMANSTYLDRAMAQARSYATLMYLGGKISTSVLNATQNYIVGQAELSRHTKGALRKILAAQKNVLTGKLTEEEARILEKGLRAGRTQAQYVREISGLSEAAPTGKLGKGISWLTQKSMVPFQWVESRWNREPALLAAYRVFRNEHKLSEEDAFKKAEDFVNTVHFVIGKENIPEVLRKLGPLGRTLYTFQSYTHNYLHWLANRVKQGETAVIGRSMLALALLGGLVALPGADDIDKWLQSLIGKAPMMELRKWLKGATGEEVADFVMHGLPSLGGVNFSRSLGVSIPFLQADQETMAERFTGVWSGVAKKVSLTGAALRKGDLYRAAENSPLTPEAFANVMRASRQYTRGATTLSGKPIFDEKGKQVRYTFDDALKKSLGFQPLGQAKRSETFFTGKRLEEYWKGRRQDMIDSYRIAKDKKAVWKDIREFNRELKDSAAAKLVKPVNHEVLIRAMKPAINKRRQAFAEENT